MSSLFLNLFYSDSSLAAAVLQKYLNAEYKLTQNYKINTVIPSKPRTAA